MKVQQLSAHPAITPLCALIVLLVLGGCVSRGVSDGPGARLDADAIADAVPRPEPVTRAGNFSPYTVFGQTYHLMESAEGYRSRGIASWYGSKFHGRLTSNGEVYDMYQMTAAHKTLPIPSYVRVTNLDNGRSAIVRVNDRGPFHADREIDLSWAAATKLDFHQRGTAQVEIVVIDPVAWQLAQQGEAASSPQSAQLPQLLEGEYLQVGAFEQPDLAHLQLLELIDKIPYAIQVLPDNGRYKVLVGPLVSPEQLQMARQQLAQQSIAAFKYTQLASCEVSNPVAKC